MTIRRFHPIVRACVLISLLLALPSCTRAQDAGADTAREQAIDSAWVAARMQRIARRDEDGRKAFQELVRGGARVVPFVQRTFRRDSGSAQQLAATVLASLGRPGVAVLIEAVRDTTRPGSFWAQTALEYAREPAVIEGITPLLSDRDAAVRRRAVEILGRMALYGDAASAAVSPLVRPALRDADANVRAAAADALGHQGQGDAANVAALAAALRDPDADVRTNAALALVLSAPAGRAATPALIERLRVDPSPEVRSRAAQALGSVGDTTAVSALLAAAGDRSGDVRDEAVDALGGVGLPRGPDAEKVLALLTAQATGRRGVQAQIAAQSLAQLDDRAIPSLLRVLAEGGDSTAAFAATALSMRPARPDVVEGLYRALGDRRAMVRDAAADAVIAFGSAQLPRLRALAAGGTPASAGAAQAVRRLEAALVSLVAETCYELRRGPWTPKLDIGEDSAFSAAPTAVRFTTQTAWSARGETSYIAAAQAGARRSRYLPDGSWKPMGRDSLSIVWSTGFSGLTMDLLVEPDGTLRGTAMPFWDFPRERQSAPVTGTKVDCRGEPAPGGF